MTQDEQHHPNHGALVVTGAGWEKANGIYLPIAEQEGARVYENSHRFLLSLERRSGSSATPTCRAWVLGVCRKPLYIARSCEKDAPPKVGWTVIEGWGKGPVPCVTPSRDVTSAVIALAEATASEGDVAADRKDWKSAIEFWQQGLDHLAHLLDIDDVSVLELQDCLHGKIEGVPVRRAQHYRWQGEQACDEGDWQKAENCFVFALQELKNRQDLEARNALKELKTLQRKVPKQKLERLRVDAREVFESGNWDIVAEKLELVKHCIQDSKNRGVVVDQQVLAEVETMQKQTVLQRVREKKANADEASFAGDWDAAEEDYAAALEVLQTSNTDIDIADLEKDLQKARAINASSHVDELLAEASQALSKEAWIEADNCLEAAEKSLVHCKGSEVDNARGKLQLALTRLAEKKTQAVRSMGDDAFDRGDLNEADACWAEALEILNANTSLSKAVPDVVASLQKQRSLVACTMAGELMRDADKDAIRDNIFDADEKYSQAIATLNGHDETVEELRVNLFAKRCEALCRKWQFKEAVSDAEYVIKHSRDDRLKHSVCLVAARSAKAESDAIKKRKQDPELKDSFWLDKAVKYMKQALKLRPKTGPESSSKALEAQLEQWQAELPKLPEPVPPVKIDWSQMPKDAKANYCGRIDRRVGFSDVEVAEIWRGLKLESKRVLSSDDVDFCGFDEKGHFKQPPPKYLGRRGFYRILTKASGAMEEDEFDAVWDNADQDGDGLLSFDEFASAMKFDDKEAKLSF